jgi:hypothetical protein
MLHNALWLRTNAVVNLESLHQKSPLAYPNILFLLETQECVSPWVLDEFGKMNLN